MDDNKRKVLSTEEEITTRKTGQGEVETTKRKSVIANEDGTTSIVNQLIEKKTVPGIIGEPQKIEEYNLGVSMEDTKYADAIRTKNDLAIMKDEKILLFIKVASFEKILKLMNESLNTYFDSIAYGIYSSEEITEFRNSIKTKPPPKKKPYTKIADFSFQQTDKLNRIKIIK